MVRHHKLSSWQPSNWNFSEEIQLQAKKAYPPRVIKKIIGAARLENVESNPDKRAELAARIENNIIHLAVWVKNWNQLSRRPTPAQRRAALKEIESRANDLHKVLTTIDGDSAEELRKVMLSDEWSYKAISATLDIRSPFYKYEKFDVIIDTVDHISAWAKTAQQTTMERKDGNKPADVKRWFAEGLIKIWTNIGYQKPTVSSRDDLHKTTGLLMEFAQAAAEPLGLKPIEAALRQAIKEWKNKGAKPPHKTPLTS